VPYDAKPQEEAEEEEAEDKEEEEEGVGEDPQPHLMLTSLNNLPNQPKM